MSMTIIFSNFGDEDCRQLRKLWKKIEDVNVLEVKYENDGPEMRERVRKAISEETDFLLFCGHGSPSGLFAPSDGELFSMEDVHLIKAKNVMCIWCYASSFWDNVLEKGIKVDFNVFTSSMYISNPTEAYLNGISGLTQESVNTTNSKTFLEMNKMYREGVPLKEWKDALMKSLDTTDMVDTFNRYGLIYFE